MIELADVWDFHTDNRYLMDDPPKHTEQLDLATCRQLGGVFSATFRIEGLSRDDQWAKLCDDAHVILAMPGLTVATRREYLDGVG